MRQKFSVKVADVTMNLVCEETQESINEAVATLNEKIGAITTAAGNACTRTEAALLAALDVTAQNVHLSARVAELEEFLHKADPTGDNFEAGMLRGDNEILRAERGVPANSDVAAAIADTVVKLDATYGLVVDYLAFVAENSSAIFPPLPSYSGTVQTEAIQPMSEECLLKNPVVTAEEAAATLFDTTADIASSY